MSTKLFLVHRTMAGPILLGLALAAQAAPPPPDLDALVERVRHEFDVPGIAIAIVKDGQPVIVKGYGVRSIHDPAPVDGETVFNIASNTKASTSDRPHRDEPPPIFRPNQPKRTREFLRSRP